MNTDSAFATYLLSIRGALAPETLEAARIRGGLAQLDGRRGSKGGRAPIPYSPAVSLCQSRRISSQRASSSSRRGIWPARSNAV